MKGEKKRKVIERYGRREGRVDEWNVIKGVIEEREKGEELYVDGGYEGKEEVVGECGMKGMICEKGEGKDGVSDEEKEKKRRK